MDAFKFLFGNFVKIKTMITATIKPPTVAYRANFAKMANVNKSRFKKAFAITIAKGTENNGITIRSDCMSNNCNWFRRSILRCVCNTEYLVLMERYSFNRYTLIIKLIIEKPSNSMAGKK